MHPSLSIAPALFFSLKQVKVLQDLHDELSEDGEVGFIVVENGVKALVGVEGGLRNVRLVAGAVGAHPQRIALDADQDPSSPLDGCRSLTKRTSLTIQLTSASPGRPPPSSHSYERTTKKNHDNTGQTDKCVRAH